jgi:hypothetical protein
MVSLDGKASRRFSGLENYSMGDSQKLRRYSRRPVHEVDVWGPKIVHVVRSKQERFDNVETF